jgi:hypothetical protein
MLRDLDLGPVPIAVRAHVAIAAERTGAAISSRWLTLAAATVLLIVALGASVFVGAGSGEGADTAPVGRAVHWTTPVVDLVADDLWIEAAGRVWVPPDDTLMKVSSDPGDRSRWTLELAWAADDVEMRMNLYFASDGTKWRIDEVRTFDGRGPGDWLESAAPVAEAPLGAAFAGDIAVELADRTGPNQGPGRLVIRGLRLSTNPRDVVALDPNGPAVKPVQGGKVPVPAIAIPPEIDVACGPMPPEACSKLAVSLWDGAARQYPARTVVAIAITSVDGDYSIRFDDGTEVGADVN